MDIDQEPETNLMPAQELANVIPQKTFQGGFITGRTEFDDVIVNSIKLGAYFVRVKVGENINRAIDKVYANGGGTVFLESGTHKPNYHIVMKNGVILEGQSSAFVFIDFQSQAYQLQIAGTDSYTDGTVTANFGSTTIEGAGVTWTAAMEGRSILLDGLWYVISSVTDGDTLEIATIFVGQNIAGAAYAIANASNEIRLVNLTIKNSALAAVKNIYSHETYINDVEVDSCAAAYDFDYVSNCTFEKSDATSIVGNVLDINIAGAISISQVGFVGSGGNGITMTNVTNSVIMDSYILGHVDGLSMTNCTACGISGTTFSRNSSNGIELVSGNSGVSILHTGCFLNGSDGIKMTGTDDYNLVSSCILHFNGAYGWNIANADCDINTMGVNSFRSNTSGTYSDSGTGTVII